MIKADAVIKIEKQIYHVEVAHCNSNQPYLHIPTTTTKYRKHRRINKHSFCWKKERHFWIRWIFDIVCMRSAFHIRWTIYSFDFKHTAFYVDLSQVILMRSYTIHLRRESALFECTLYFNHFNVIEVKNEFVCMQIQKRFPNNKIKWTNPNQMCRKTAISNSIKAFIMVTPVIWLGRHRVRCVLDDISK